VLVALVLVVACDSAPAEPPAPTAVRKPTVAPTLMWKAPAAWRVAKTASDGKYRAKYSIPTQGDSKHPAELLVQRFNGPKELPIERDYYLRLFEKTAGPQTEQLTVGDFQVEWVEINGTYRFPMGPPMGKKRKHSAHVLKDDWSALFALVKTTKRGHWFFHMVGPADTVASARSAFRAMIETLEKSAN